MKNFTFLAFAVVLLLSATSASAQKPTSQATTKTHVHTQRCHTMEYYEELFRTNPAFKAQFEANQQRLEEAIRNRGNMRTAAVNDTISVVIHVVGSAAMQAAATDAALESQITVLTEDFKGLNADSSRIPAAFKPLFGKMGLHFQLAQTAPDGTPTNGIVRRTNAVTYTAGTSDNIKSNATGGLDAWDPTKYFNMWVGTFTDGLLGISVFPGDPRPIGMHGFVADYRSFGRIGSHLYPEFNKGRTATHEIGHFWNLRHIWGDDGSACSGTDFPATSFPPGTDDTPNQGGPTFGDPDPAGVGTVVTDACSNAAPGIMYQNYMDYSDDPALVMFTNGQATRMEGALLLAPDRAPILTSNTYNPPVLVPNNASISAIIAPAVGSFVCDAPFTPQATIRNLGTSTLTSVTVTVTLNGNVVETRVINGLNLATGASTNVTLNTQNAITGNNTVAIATSLPNGVADQLPGDDSRSVTFSRVSGVSLPATATFEGTAFPPTPFLVVNPNSNTTWERRTPVNNGSTAGMYINNFDFSLRNQIDDFRSPVLSTAGANIISIGFDIAHKNYPTAGFHDTLSIEVSTDCGNTFTSVWKRYGPTLATAGSSTAGYTTPAPGDWVRHTIDVGAPFTSSGNMIVAIRNINGFGNNIFIDNVNIDKKVNRDVRVQSIVRPVNNQCSETIAPRIVVHNNGLEAVTQFRVGYRVDNGPVVQTAAIVQTIAAGATATVDMPAFTTTVGNHSFAAYTFEPVTVSGVGDQLMTNDTTKNNFTVISLRNQEIQEGFEVTPVQGWSVFNPNANNTWVVKTPGRNSARSAFIDNYNFDLVGQVDDLRPPAMNTTNADSMFLAFDVAYKYYSATLVDTVSILVSTDCGNTFTTVYKKWGTQLGAASTADYVTPLDADWRRERVAVSTQILNTGSVVFAIRNSNGFGNNVFIDNVNIGAIYRRDLEMVSINQPGALICNNNVTPSVTVRNKGVETITGFKVSYTIDGGAIQTTTVTGVNIATNTTTTVTLNNITVGAGNHTLRAFTWDPISVSGTGDQYKANDSLSKGFSFAGTIDAPFTESFEGTFAPAGWSTINPDASITWQGATVGRMSNGSAYMNNFNYTAGQRDELITPMIRYDDADSAKLTFDLSAMTRQYPGSTASLLDTLEVLITTDCGNTFTSVYKKWGEDLQTVDNPNYSNSAAFRPGGDYQWRTETIDLTAFRTADNPMIVFRNSSSGDNNIYIDNVSFSTRILPDQLKQRGYMVLPTVTTNSFSVWHIQDPVGLRYVTVYSSTGQLVYTQSFNKNAQRLITVDLSGQPAGTYIVNIGYEDGYRNVTERVIKR